MYCSRCSTFVDDGLAFCTNCGLPQTETPTVVIQSPAKHKSGSKAFIVGAAIIALAAIAVFVGLASFERANRRTNMDAETTPNSATPSSTSSTTTPTTIDRYDQRNSADQINRSEETAINANRAVANAIREQERIERQRAINEAIEQQRIDREVTANAVANARRASSINANIVQPSYPPFDRNGKPLRATCENGEPSYWQGDRWATCLLKGGVAVWVRP